MPVSEYLSPQSDEYRLRYLHQYLKYTTEMIRKNGYGGVINIFAEPNDPHRAPALAALQEALDVDNSRVRRLSIEQLATMLTFGVQRHKLGIADDSLNRQSLAENIFQVVYQGFGRIGEGWRIGRSHLVDALKMAGETDRADLSDTPFAEFIESLSFDELDKNRKRRLTIVTYPTLSLRPITQLREAEPGFLTPETAERVEKYLSILSLILQVYPSRFIADNPDGNVVVNILDNSYRWFSARNSRWFYTYQALCDMGIATPSAYRKDKELINKDWHDK